MIESVAFDNFTAFKHAKIDFSPNLTVIVGENSTGKSHILKAAYSILCACAGGKQEQGSSLPKKTHLQASIAKKLTSVFRPDELGRLTRRTGRGRIRSEVACRFFERKHNVSFSFNTTSKSEVVIENTPHAWLEKMPVYLPTRELLTIYRGFVPLYETTHLEFDETWRDACILLGAPLAKGPREARIRELLVPLEDAMGGKVDLDQNGGFYLIQGGAKIEMQLVAEGLRKLAMVARLIATGMLVDKGVLIWDEPEANLNPKVIKLVASTIMDLCQSGIQVMVASHSLFFLRELDILARGQRHGNIKMQFVGLHTGTNGVTVEQGDSIDDIGRIDALQEELSQCDRYLMAEPQ